MAAQEPPGSACTKATHGTLWPVEANTDRPLAHRLIQAGELYMCRVGNRRSRWELLGVHINALQSRTRKKELPVSEPTAPCVPRVCMAKR